jgi:hypothetical protein
MGEGLESGSHAPALESIASRMKRFSPAQAALVEAGLQGSAFPGFDKLSLSGSIKVQSILVAACAT